MRQKIKERLSDRRGLTMVELIVTVSLAILLIAAAGGIYIASTRIFGGYVDKTEQKQMMDILAQQLKNEITYASGMEISHEDSTKISSNHYLKFGSDGRVYLDGSMLYNEDYYGKRMINVSICPETENATEDQEDGAPDRSLFHMTVRLCEGDTMLYETGIYVRLQNIEMKKTRSIQYPQEYDTEQEYNNLTSDLYIFYKAD